MCTKTTTRTKCSTENKMQWRKKLRVKVSNGKRIRMNSGLVYTEIFFDDAIQVKSICIDINDSTFAEAFTVLTGKKEINLDNIQASYFFSPDFFENIYHLENSNLDKALLSVIDIIKNNLQHEINEETFLLLAEQIIFHQYRNTQSLHAITSAKSSTRKEILRRLLAGKNFIDEGYLINPSISAIAAVANLSEYHFFRSFRQAFSITPYQYMLQKRLEHSRGLIENGSSIDNAAAACGFSDIFSFSKAFKKKYAYSPSLLKLKRH